MNETIKNIMARRTCRVFTAEPLPDGTLDAIIEAGRFAPSGNNSQFTKFIVFTSPEKREALDTETREALRRLQPAEDEYPPIVRFHNRAMVDGYSFTYHAPAVILTANKRGYINAEADSACALENMFIAATSLGIGSCWVNQPHWLDGDAGLDAFLKTCGLEEDEFITGGVSLGFPKNPPAAPQPRKGNPVVRVG